MDTVDTALSRNVTLMWSFIGPSTEPLVQGSSKTVETDLERIPVYANDLDALSEWAEENE